MGAKIGHIVELPFAVSGPSLGRLLDSMESMWPDAICEYDETSEGGLEQPFFKLRCRSALPGAEFSELFIYRDESAYQAWERNQADECTLVQFLFFEDRTVAVLPHNSDQISRVQRILTECRDVEDA